MKPIPAGKLTRIIAAGDGLRTDDPAAYRALLLVANCGLRAGEAATVTGADVAVAPRGRDFELTVGIKHHPMRIVPVSRAIALQLKTAEPGNFVVSGSDADSSEKAVRRLSRWLVSKFQIERPLAALRCAWCQRMAAEHGEDQASLWAGRSAAPRQLRRARQ